MYCGNCGTKNEEGSKFCSNCGATIAPKVQVIDKAKKAGATKFALALEKETQNITD